VFLLSIIKNAMFNLWLTPKQPATQDVLTLNPNPIPHASAAAPRSAIYLK
jgi:hypothetical protein